MVKIAMSGNASPGFINGRKKPFQIKKFRPRGR